MLIGSSSSSSSCEKTPNLNRSLAKEANVDSGAASPSSSSLSSSVVSAGASAFGVLVFLVIQTERSEHIVV